MNQNNVSTLAQYYSVLILIQLAACSTYPPKIEKRNRISAVNPAAHKAVFRTDIGLPSNCREIIRPLEHMRKTVCDVK